MLLEGKAFWVKLDKPSDLSGKYELTLGHLTPKSIEELKNAGIKVRTCDEEDKTKNKGKFVVLKSKEQIPVVNLDKTPFTGKLSTIGNGSVVRVLAHTWEWTFGTKRGVSVDMDKVQIINLKRYDSRGSEEFPDDVPMSETVPTEEDPF